MRHEILDSPDFAMLKVTFDQPGEQVVAEAGAMVSMSGGVDMRTSMRGGVLAAAKRKLLGGESIFQNTFVCTAREQEVMLAPAAEGDLRHRKLQPGESMFLQSGAYVAHAGPEMTLDTKWGGAKGFFAGVGLFLLKVTGPGDLFYACYGAMHEVEVGPAGYTCDTGHIVAFTEGLQYAIRKFGGFKGLFFSGEGLVCDFSGHGKLVLQTRNAGALASFLEPFRPTQSRD